MISNPLARPLMRIIEAIEGDPKYAEEYATALQEHAAHACELLRAHQEGDKFASLLMMAAINGFTAEDYYKLGKLLEQKAAPYRNELEAQTRQVKHQQAMAQLQAHRKMLELGRALMKQENELTKQKTGFFDTFFKGKV